jgi:hypothetical protein
MATAAAWQSEARQEVKAGIHEGVGNIAGMSAGQEMPKVSP